MAMDALVTGGTSGIGRAIAVALAEDGYRVTVIGRRKDELAVLASSHGISGVAADLTRRDELADAVAGLAPDVLVNNAGILPPLSNFCDMDETEIEHTVAINLTSVMKMTRLVAPGMRARGRGHIFFTGSTAGHAPFPNLAAYCATKAAVGAFGQALRLDLAPSGVRVTEIVAGRVETGLYRDILSAEARAAMYANHSAVQPQDVATMVLAVLKLPHYVDVSRFDILPTHQTTATGAARKEQ
jgi:3-hydroxy acid dehydrogenase / malonic semialdehyde reductase